jgi:23S rRNA pseudouridine1911/1915/1917 synthase
LQIPVLYEDGDLIAVDKPAGMPSHALRADETDTVANFLLARFPEVAGIGTHTLEAGLVHRLDTETSGVLLAARNAAAHRALRRQFRDRRVEKEYLAVVEGDVAHAGQIRTPIAHAAHNRRKMRIATAHTPGARPAETSYRPLEGFGDTTVLAVEIRSGVMHQIRVHLASVGHPVVGDPLYGHAGGRAAPRHLLHASRLLVQHPVSGRGVEIRSPLPADFVGYLEGLRRRRMRGC